MLCLKGHAVVIIFFVLVWPFSAFAMNPLPNDDVIEEHEQVWWQGTHQRVSKTIGRWSSDMDAFFSGQPSSSLSNSYVGIRFGSIFENNSTSGLFDLHAKWRLPNTKKRLKLVLDSSGDTLAPESISGESSQQKNAVESALKTSVSAAVRFAKDDLDMDFDLGILVDFPLDPFMRLRFKQGSIKEGWYWYQKEEAFAYYSKGVGARYGLGGGYQLTPTLGVGTDVSIVWLDQEGLFYSREDIFLQHNINEKKQLRYELSFLQSGKNQLRSDTVLYSVEYNKFLYKNWLSGQIKPQMTHEEEDDYTGEWSLTLSLRVLMGPEYLR